MKRGWEQERRNLVRDDTYFFLGDAYFLLIMGRRDGVGEREDKELLLRDFRLLMMHIMHVASQPWITIHQLNNIQYTFCIYRNVTYLMYVLDQMYTQNKKEFSWYVRVQTCT